jgi:uncharacterized membrane protein YdjX (TVP38/TMEM64 family)
MDSIEHAERSIYIENQFLSSIPVAQKIAQQMRRKPQLEVLAITPKSYKSPLIANTLGHERAIIGKLLHECGPNRVRIAYPCVQNGKASADVMVHSKVMVIDDRFLRIGSANLNNRSMGADTECDLAIEARHQNERENILYIRNLLLAHHCGASMDQVKAELARSGSLIAAADRLSTGGHSLQPVRDEQSGATELDQVAREVVDPDEPLQPQKFLQRLSESLPLRLVLTAFAVAIIILGLTALWHLTPISDLATRERVQTYLSSASESAWAPILVLGVYLIAGLIAFPVVILIVATALTFGPIYGFLYALVGVLASAMTLYLVGATLGRDLVRSLLGARWEKAKREIESKGILAVAAVRLVPIAPFSFVNLVAGACSVRISDYIVGTIIGMLPGLIVISASGHRLAALLSDFSLNNLALLLAIIAVWGALAWAAQALTVHFRKGA